MMFDHQHIERLRADGGAEGRDGRGSQGLLLATGGRLSADKRIALDASVMMVAQGPADDAPQATTDREIPAVIL
ncbi:MAG TPA: hypothetical protein VFN48_00145, partial [Solirubrobacteraceae bacterium]|nr:hypothetical protein [Solirubrobacteraceae bacterium]